MLGWSLGLRGAVSLAVVFAPVGALMFIGAVTLGPSPAHAQAGAQGPSFDCRYAKLPSERRICRSRRLSQLDREMAATYFELRKGLRSRRAQRRLSDAQNSWLIERNGCGQRRRCLRRKYRQRIVQLEDALFAARDSATRTRRPARVEPSFDCRDARGRVELAICERPRLARLDNQLAALYADVTGLAERRSERRALRDSQKDWLADRNRCRPRGGCIRDAYDDRIVALSNLKLELEAARRPRVEPSFDCRRDHKAAERTICARDGLARLDNEMAALYVAVRDGYGRRGDRTELRDEQRAWLRKRSRCEADVRCLRDLFVDRIVELELRRDAQNVGDGGARGVFTTSFNCGRSSNEIEQMICASEELAALDVELQEVYDGALQSRDDRGRRSLRNRQRAWIDARDRCGTSYDCVRQAYENRIYVLSEAGGGPSLRQ